MAKFVAEGQRIPRRGEVGIDAQQINDLEAVGFVMSGSRHKMMNAVRMRKENQVYSAEEKKALLLYNYEENQQRENKIMADFRAMIQAKYGEDAVPSEQDEAVGDSTTAAGGA